MRVLIALTLFLCPLPAATIGNVTIQNNSTADYTTNTASQIAEFRSYSAGPSPITTNGDTSTFTSRFTWFLGQRAVNSDPDAPQATANVSYEISFDITDATNAGFLLLIDTTGRGWNTGSYDSSANGAGMITVDGGMLAASIGINGNFAPASELDFQGGSASADENNTNFFNDFIAATGQFFTFGFGSQSITIRFDGVASTVSATSQTTGEAAIRFGLNPTLAGFVSSSSPGFDGESVDVLGHSVSISMVSLSAQSPSEIPEPSTAVLLLAGSMLLGLRKFRLAVRSFKGRCLIF